MIWYGPDPSVTVDRVFSISAGLEASTVTPGKHRAGGVFHDPGDRRLGERGRWQQRQTQQKRRSASVQYRA